MTIAQNHQLILSIIKKNIEAEVDHILSIALQGFDVQVEIAFAELKDILKESFQGRLKQSPDSFRLLDGVRGLQQEDLCSTFTANQSFDFQPKKTPIILLDESRRAFGYGFINYRVCSPDQLIGSVSRAVSHILSYFGLDLYIDVFDGAKLTRLKQIAKVCGVRHLIDAVVQTAYLAGFKGNAEEAQTYLDRLPFSFYEDLGGGNGDSIEMCAKKFLAHVISHGEHAYSFLKSCLSYYIVNGQGHTMSRASEILNVSRTTLLEHLKSAPKLGVSRFFEGAQQNKDSDPPVH